MIIFNVLYLHVINTATIILLYYYILYNIYKCACPIKYQIVF